jgi:hypothetical protein
MNFAFRLLSIAVLLLNFRLFADDASRWKIQATGLRIVVSKMSTKEDQEEDFFQPPGVTVGVRITPVSGKIVDIDPFESKVSSFSDDKGTDLLAAKVDDSVGKQGLGFINNKNSFATTEIQAYGLPVKGATTLNISGKFAAKIALGTEQFTVENVNITTNTSFSCRNLRIKIAETGFEKAPISNEKEFYVTFSSTNDLAVISKLEFFDAQRNKIESRKSRWGVVEIDGNKTYSVQFAFKKSVDHARIEATCWTDLKAVEVPFFIETDLGF